MSSIYHQRALNIHSVLINMINVSDSSSRIAAEQEVYFLSIKRLPSVTSTPADPPSLYTHAPHTHILVLSL